MAEKIKCPNYFEDWGDKKISLVEALTALRLLRAELKFQNQKGRKYLKEYYQEILVEVEGQIENILLDHSESWVREYNEQFADDEEGEVA